MHFSNQFKRHPNYGGILCVVDLSISMEYYDKNNLNLILKEICPYYVSFRFNSMVFRLDGNSEIGAHLRSNLCHLSFSN